MDIINLIDTIIDLASRFFNSPFFLAIAGTGVAAFAGTYGAYHIIRKHKQTDDIISEIQSTNTAISVAFSICDKYLALKDQHLKSMIKEYNQKKLEAIKYNERLNSGLTEKDELFEFNYDFKTIAPFVTSIDILQKQVFKNITVTGRPLLLTTTLTSIIESLTLVIHQRNQLIEAYKISKPPPQPTSYFGLPGQDGHVDNVYPDYMDAISVQTDDCIFFSNLLCVDLNEHGEKLKKKLGKNGSGITITKCDFSKSQDKGLMPNEDDYKDWITMFSKKPDEEKGKSASK